MFLACWATRALDTRQNITLLGVMRILSLFSVCFLVLSSFWCGVKISAGPSSGSCLVPMRQVAVPKFEWLPKPKLRKLRKLRHFIVNLRTAKAKINFYSRIFGYTKTTTQEHCIANCKHTHTHTHTDTYRPTDYFNPLMAAFPVAAPGNSVNATTTNASWGGNVFPLCEARINQSSMNINSQSPLKAKPSIPIAQALCHALRLGVRCTRRNMCCYRKQICYI